MRLVRSKASPYLFDHTVYYATAGRLANIDEDAYGRTTLPRHPVPRRGRRGTRGARVRLLWVVLDDNAILDSHA